MAEKAEPVLIEEITDDLTLTQLKARLDAVTAEHNAIIDNKEDRSLVTTTRLRELQSYSAALEEQLDAISAVAFTKIAEKELPAEPVELAEQPAKLEVVATEDKGDVKPVEEEADDDDTAALEESQKVIAASLKKGKPGQGSGVKHDTGLTPDEVLTPGTHHNGAPIFATAGDAGSEDTQVSGATSLEAIARKLSRAKTTIPNFDATDRLNLFRVDRSKEGARRLGNNIDENTAILAEARMNSGSVQAAADLNICGQPTEITVNGCTFDNSTPFLDALAGNTVNASNCKFKWRQPLGLAAIDVPPAVWTVANQAGVDPADASTWKPLATLPVDCAPECVVEPIDVTRGLLVDVNDEFCRPEMIQEANNAIDCLEAQTLEQLAMRVFDWHAGLANHYTYDASGDGLGAVHAIYKGLKSLIARTNLGRHNNNFNNYWAQIDAGALATIETDQVLAGQASGSGLAALTDLLNGGLGVSRVVVTKDFGSEGVLTAPLPFGEAKCGITNAELATVTGEAFGAGQPVPGLPSQARIRLFDPSDWYHGTTNIVDYALRRGPDALRRNQAEYFGERRDFLFKASSCGSYDLVLDIDNICANGQRVRHNAAVDC